MDKTEFLNNEDVSQFVGWLVERLPRIEFRLAFSASRFVPGGLHDNVVGIEAVLGRYVWKTSWNDQGAVVTSDDWVTTKASLRGLRTRLLEAQKAGDDAAMLAACLSVLEWGGVSGAIPFLRRKVAAGQLVGYLSKAQAALELDENRSLEEIDPNNIERFDAGLTKIHALLDTTGLPIYDSRVGAAIAMLYALYRAEAGTAAPRASPVQGFPSGSARGRQVRNPRALDARYPAAPTFYTTGVSHVSWAQSQVKLGWIIQEVLRRTDWFSADGGGLPARSHAFEAALFMVGYDLRCFGAGQAAAAQAPATRRSDATTWVPTAHTFSTLFARYAAYRKELAADGVPYDDAVGNGFRKWLNQHHGPYTEGVLQAYCFPFKQTEFDLFERPVDEIIGLHAAIDAGDTASIAAFLNDFAMQSDERRNVCLVDAWCVGYLRSKGFKGAQSGEMLVRAGFAGTKNAAAALLQVGGNVGRYLKLLDQNGQPTPLFHRYVGDRMNDLAEQLDQAIPS